MAENMVHPARFERATSCFGGKLIDAIPLINNDSASPEVAANIHTDQLLSTQLSTQAANAGNYPVLLRLSAGHFALIDPEDAPRVNQFKWHVNVKKSGVYAQRAAGPGEFRYLHQFILGRKWVDHENGWGIDCRRANLRPCDRSGNNQNRCISSASDQPFKGIAPRGDKWRAYIYVNDRRKWLGTFDTAEQAALAYNEAAALNHGEFAKPNVLPPAPHAEPVEVPA